MTRPTYLGHGVGLRVRHYARALNHGLDVDWVEAISENFFGAGGRPHAVLERIRSDLPVVFHGVSLAVGSLQPPSETYLDQLRQLFARYQPAWVSDHLCWGRRQGHHAHELLPVPYTEVALRCVCERVRRVQDQLGRAIALENVSSYIEYTSSEVPEWEFLNQVAARTGCGLLLDLNNIVVSGHNHGYTPEQYLAGIDGRHVWQFHLANHSDRGHYRFDDHRGPVPEEVWQLFAAALKRWGPISSLIEWDEDVPEWELLRAQQREAARRAELVLGPVSSVDGATQSVPPRRTCPELGADEWQEVDHTEALFWQAMVFPTGAQAFCDAQPSEQVAALAATFRTTPAFARIARLDVYANSYFWRLHGVILTQYPVLAWLLGDTQFHNLMVDYILERPSTGANISDFGRGLARYLQTHALGCTHAWAAEIAAVEWSSYALIDAEDSPVVTTQALVELSAHEWPTAVFAPIAAVKMVDCTYPFAMLDKSRRAGEPRPRAVGQTDTKQVIVWRQAFIVRYRHVEPAEAAALSALLQRATFIEICACAQAVRRELSAGEVAAWLRTWVRDGLLRAIVLPKQ